MASSFLGNIVRRSCPIYNQLGSKASFYTKSRIGKREIVGYGINGTYCYTDRLSFPMPAVRFREPNNESKCLNAKEQLSWKKLNMQEKKALYRHSFCRTFSEIKAPNGQWKLHVGLGLFSIAIGVWHYIINCVFLFGELPETFDDEHQLAQFKRMLILENEPITGLMSEWDYENNRWKKKRI